MKKKIPVIIALILTIAAAVFMGNTRKANRIYDNNVNTISYADLGVLEDGRYISQEFICREDVIDGFIIKSSVAGNHADVTVHLQLKDAQTGEILAEASEQGSNIRARKMHFYKMDTMSGMKGKDLILTVTEEGAQNGSGILMYYAPGQETQFRINVDGEELDGVLPMATATDRFDTETCVIFLLSLWFIWGFMWALYKLFQ